MASHAHVFKSMDVIVCMHAILSIGTLTEVETKNQVWLELGIYFDELMRIANIIDLEISRNTMHQYVVGLATLKTMIHMLSDELDRDTKPVYPNETEEKFHFQKDVTIEVIDTIIDYQAWHQFSPSIIARMSKSWYFHICLSLSDFLHGLLKHNFFSHAYMCKM